MPDSASPPSTGPVRHPGGQHLVELADDLLAIAQHEAVDEVGQGFGVEGAVAAGHHQRVPERTVGASHRHPGQIDQVEDVGIGQLGREVEGQDIEGSGGQMVFQREEGNLVGPAYCSSMSTHGAYDRSATASVRSLRIS